MIKSAQAPELQPAYSSAYDQTSTSRIPLTIVTTRATGTHSGEMGHQASVIKGHKFANFKLLATSGVATTTRGAIEDLLETTEIMAAKRLEGILKTKRGKSFRGKWVTEEIGGHGPGTKSG